MSFSQEVKSEIVSSEEKNISSPALLLGVVLSCGSLVIGSKGVSFIVASENMFAIEFYKKLILSSYPSAKTEIREENIGFKQKTRIEMSIDPENGRQILSDLGIISFKKDSSFIISRIGQKHITIESEAKKDFLKGMFLGAGSVSIPEHINLSNFSNNMRSNGYHLQWCVNAKEQADYIGEILAEFDIISGQVQRNDEFVVYLKEADNISSVLGLMGAFKSVLVLENERAGREMRNLVNRQANCISANIDKSLASAKEQLDAIEKISQNIGIDALPQNLKEVALARLDNPEGTLSDILEMLETKISKGALSQRFKKIIAISKEV